MDSRRQIELVRDESLIDEIFEKYRNRLESVNSAFLRDPEAVRQLRQQVSSIVSDVLDRPRSGLLAEASPVATTTMGGPRRCAESGGRPPERPPEDGAARLSMEIATSRAARGVHPAESLRAASLLFEVALPVIVARRGADAEEVSATLHGSIMDRIGLASVTYVNFLMEKLHASRQEERRRIARELHDRIGHGMGLALQNLDLYRFYEQQEPDRAKNKVTAAIAALGDALRTVQDLSAELRRSVGAAGIERSLQAYLRANVPADVVTSAELSGEASRLSADQSEELYLILREAVRNALRHARPGRISVRLEIGPEMLVARVVDDGRGFHTDEVAARRGGGLLSMRERAELLHGRFDVRSRVNGGTTVTVRVPLDKELR